MDEYRLFLFIYELLHNLEGETKFDIFYNFVPKEVTDDYTEDSLQNVIGVYIKGGVTPKRDLATGQSCGFNKRVQILVRGDSSEYSTINISSYLERVKNILNQIFNCKDIKLTAEQGVGLIKKSDRTVSSISLIPNLKLEEDTQYSINLDTPEEQVADEDRARITISNINVMGDVNYLGLDELSLPIYSLNLMISYD